MTTQVGGLFRLRFRTKQNKRKTLCGIYRYGHYYSGMFGDVEYE